MKNKKHSNDNWEKITYWIKEMSQASYNNDVRGVDHAHRKLDYFIGRQWNETDLYPHLDEWDNPYNIK